MVINPSAFAQETSGTNGTSTETNETESTNSTSTSDVILSDEIMVDEMMNDEDEMMTPVISPLKQIKEGIASESVVCKDGLELVFNISGQPAYIQSTSVEKLIAWAWTQ